MTSALVTGGGGFLGRYIVEMLVERGVTVRSFSRKHYSELDALGVESAIGDIRDKDAVQRAVDGVEVVYHVAAIAGISNHWPTFHGINTIGTENVIKACQSAGVRKLVYTSSPSVCFHGKPQEGVDESDSYPETWLAHYPHSKALAEANVLQAHDPNGLLTCALRPHLIWGPRDQHLIPRLLDRARSGRLRIVGDGTNLIDNVYVENAAIAHLQAADCLAPGSAVGGQAYYITQGEPVLCWQWINDILELAGEPPIKKRISFAAAYRIGWLMECAFRAFRVRSEPPMTRFLAAQLALPHYFSIEAAQRDFGYQPVVSMKEGMSRLAEDLGKNSV